MADGDTAAEIGSGDVPVLATPRLLTLAECTCVEAIAGELPDGMTTVGAHAEIDHDRPSPVGAEVDVEAKLIGHHGRRLEFNVTFRQGGDVVARVQHRRMIVDRDRFLERCRTEPEADAEVSAE